MQYTRRLFQRRKAGHRAEQAGDFSEAGCAPAC